MIEQFASLFQTAITLLALAALWFLWRRTAIEQLRQDMFAIRDRLFDLALSNKDKGFSLESASYHKLRRHFHAGIRFAHRVNMLQVVFFFIFKRAFFRKFTLPESLKDRVDLAADADCAVQSEIIKLLHEWDNAVILFLRRTSPLFHLAFVSIVAFLLLKRLIPWVQSGTGTASTKVSSAVWADVVLAEEGSDADKRFDEEARLQVA